MTANFVSRRRISAEIVDCEFQFSDLGGLNLARRGIERTCQPWHDNVGLIKRRRSNCGRFIIRNDFRTGPIRRVHEDATVVKRQTVREPSLLAFICVLKRSFGHEVRVDLPDNLQMLFRRPVIRRDKTATSFADQVPVRDKASQNGYQLGRVVQRNLKAVDPMLDPFSKRADISDDRRQPGNPCFAECDAKCFRPNREMNGNIGLREMMSQFFLMEAIDNFDIR